MSDEPVTPDTVKVWCPICGGALTLRIAIPGFSSGDVVSSPPFGTPASQPIATTMHQRLLLIYVSGSKTKCPDCGTHCEVRSGVQLFVAADAPESKMHRMN